VLSLAILASGGGSNLKAIIEAAEDGCLGNLKPELCIADRPCKAMEIAAAAGLELVYLDRYRLGENLSEELNRVLSSRHMDVVALAGWLSILNQKITGDWEGKMVNIHPSLLPLHGGVGMHGHHVHQAVIAAGEKESGCTVHLVSAGVDEGEILGQSRVPVLENDTPETLAERILREEHILYPRVLSELDITPQRSEA
jgi:phosphoribosylglycinamide formyltransferase-1